MTVSTTAIDLSPILQPLIQIAGLVLTGVATWAVARVAQLAGLGKQEALKTALLAGIDRGISFGQQKADSLVASGVSVDVHNQVAAEALNYVVSKFPSYLKQLGMNEQHVADLILAKLPAPAASAG